jgi:multiple sugar transport system ATP-binding protein
LLERKPSQLSGGQQQRVALGRCIVRNPKVFLFDEPLSNLDAKLRSQMRSELKRLRSRVETTSIFVTHDQVEAMTLGDRVVVMKDGLIQQAGTPLEVYSRPSNRFVASFIGSPAMNFMDARVQASASGAVVDTGWARMPVPADLDLQGMDSVVIGLRPEHIAIDGNASAESHVSFQARIEVIEHLGAEVILEVIAGNQVLTISGVNPHLQLEVGDTLQCNFAIAKAFLFDVKSEEAIYA